MIKVKEQPTIWFKCDCGRVMQNKHGECLVCEREKMLFLKKESQRYKDNRRFA